MESKRNRSTCVSNSMLATVFFSLLPMSVRAAERDNVPNIPANNPITILRAMGTHGGEVRTEVNPPQAPTSQRILPNRQSLDGALASRFVKTYPSMPSTIFLNNGNDVYCPFALTSSTTSRISLRNPNPNFFFSENVPSAMRSVTLRANNDFLSNETEFNRMEAIRRYCQGSFNHVSELEIRTIMNRRDGTCLERRVEVLSQWITPRADAQGRIEPSPQTRETFVERACDPPRSGQSHSKPTQEDSGAAKAD